MEKVIITPRGWVTYRRCDSPTSHPGDLEASFFHCALFTIMCSQLASVTVTNAHQCVSPKLILHF